MFMFEVIMYRKADGLLVLIVENLNIHLIDNRFCVSHTCHLYYPFRPLRMYDLIW